MSALGPEGFRELGEAIIQRSNYCARLLARVPGVRVRHAQGFFKEFVVNFDATGKSVAQINASLLERGIFGGLDLSRSFPDLGQSSLYCVTEVHSVDDLHRLATALQEACGR
jgi:glycine dehydrogenase subunit 1